jgi:glycosyltransferase involved in cell wall biosynthesis
LRLALIGPVHPYRGGIAHYTTMLCRALRQRGHEVLPVSFRRQYPSWLFPGRTDRDPSKEPLKVLDARFWIDSLNPLTWLVTFLRVRSYAPDVLIMQWWTAYWAPAWFTLGLLNRLFAGIPLVYICHNVMPHEERCCDQALSRLALRWGSSFIVQSNREEERLLELFPRALSVVVRHPVYDLFASKGISRRAARERLGLPAEAPVLLFFGIVREYKGLADVLAAMPAVKSQLGQVKLIVAGEFWDDKRPYLDMIDELQLADSVILDDRYIPNEEVPLYFAAADLLVAPYRSTTGSGAVQMAAGFGCPAITTGDARASLADETLLVEPSDASGLAHAITRFFKDKRGARSGRRSAAGKGPDWSDLAASVERLVRECT